MAIGDGLNDILMMRECDISIEICDDINNIYLNSGDIITDELDQIRDLVMVHGRKMQYNIN